MDNATKNKLTSGTDQADLTSGNACWETPPKVFEKLDADFGPFDVDLTADPGRALCPLWFGPGSPYAVDALACMWMAWAVMTIPHQEPKGYSNPPFGPFIQRLLERAKREARAGFASTLLLPMRVTKAFKAHVLDGASELLFCDSRLTFFEQGVPRLNQKQFEKGKLTPDPAVFDSIVVRYVPHRTVLQVGVWHVPKHVSAEDLARAAARKTQLVA